MRPEQHDGGDSEGASRLRQRLSRRLGWAMIVGPALGIATGLVIGSIWFRFGSTGFWMVLTGCIVFVTAVSILVAGYSSLESPDPADEPSSLERPIGERSGLTREERGPG